MHGGTLPSFAAIYVACHLGTVWHVSLRSLTPPTCHIPAVNGFEKKKGRTDVGSLGVLGMGLRVFGASRGILWSP